MSDHPAPTATPRRWIAIGTIAATALGGAGTFSAPAQAGALPLTQQTAPALPQQPIRVQATEGGEGGEGGEGVAPSDDAAVDFLADLAFMQGHARAGLELYRQGIRDLGVVHIGHPIVEKYAAVAEPLEELGLSEVRDLLVEMSEAAEAGADVAALDTLYAGFSHELDEAREAVADPVAELAALARLMRLAGDEYTAAFADGQITDPKEYQDAWGFVTVIRAETERLSAAPAVKVAEAAAQMTAYVDQTMQAFGGVDAKGPMTFDPALIYAAAAQMEFAAIAAR